MLPYIYLLHRDLLLSQPCFSTLSPATLRSFLFASSGIIVSYTPNRGSAGILSEDAIDLILFADIHEVMHTTSAHQIKPGNLPLRSKRRLYKIGIRIVQGQPRKLV
jgi:hypothetical protein